MDISTQHNNSYSTVTSSSYFIIIYFKIKDMLYINLWHLFKFRDSLEVVLSPQEVDSNPLWTVWYHIVDQEYQ